MSRQANPTIIGGFVLGAVVIVIVAILALSSGVLRQRIVLVTEFPGSVQGLVVGAQVQFQGVPIGQVVNIGLDYLADRNAFRVPVTYEIWPETVRVFGNPGSDDARDVLQQLILTRGLHARLDPVSFVTGQYLVTLVLVPGLPAPVSARDADGLLLVPALPATRDRMAELVDNIDVEQMVATVNDTLVAVRKVIDSGALQQAITDLDDLLVQGRRLLTNLDRRVTDLGDGAAATLTGSADLVRTLNRRIDGVADTLEATSKAVGTLAGGLDGRLAPLTASATTTLDEATRTLRAVRELAEGGEVTRAELDRMLAEVTRAARSVRALSDTLERQPESLLRGRR